MIDSFLNSAPWRVGRLVLKIGDSLGIAVETISANQTLTAKSALFLRLDGGVADRNIGLYQSADKAAGGIQFIHNAGTTNNLVVKYGSTTVKTLAPGDWGFFYSVDGTVWYGSVYGMNAVTTELAAIVAENTDVLIPLSLHEIYAVSGTWTGSRTGTAAYRVRRTAGAATEALAIRANALRLRTASNKGLKINGLKIQYTISTAAATDFTPSIGYTVMPANASAIASASTLGTITYDSNHDTSGKRGGIGEHTMTVTFGSPVYLNDAGAFFEILLTVNAALTTVLDINQVMLACSETLVDAA